MWIFLLLFNVKLKVNWKYFLMRLVLMEWLLKKLNKIVLDKNLV